MNLEHLVVPESKEMLKNQLGQKDIETSLRAPPLAKSRIICTSKEIMIIRDFNSLHKLGNHECILI